MTASRCRSGGRYAEMAAHYDTAIVPARPYKPRDKAKVEVAVLVATRWIIAKLRKRTFFSLAELNAAIAIEVAALNGRVTRHLGASRKALFEELECPALKSLPAEPYTYAQWKECKLGLDYHVEVEKHYYSVPYQLLREKMWVRIGASAAKEIGCLPFAPLRMARASTPSRNSRAKSQRQPTSSDVCLHARPIRSKDTPDLREIARRDLERLIQRPAGTILTRSQHVELLPCIKSVSCGSKRPIVR